METRRETYRGCGEFRLTFDDPVSCKPNGWLEGDSFETLHRFVVDALLPKGVEIEPGDLLGDLSDDGWAPIAVGHIYTRPFGEGRTYQGDLSESQLCYAQVISNHLHPAARYGDAPAAASAGRIARLELARPWRGRGLGRRVLRSAVDRLPETVYVFGLDAVPYAPRESGRTDEEAQLLVETFWTSAGFVRCPDPPTAFAASRMQINEALADVSSLE